MAWGLATFLVVPIVALEGLGPLAALDRSASLFRQKWGEQLVGTASIGLLFALLGTLPAVALMFLGFASGSGTLAIALVVVGVLIAVAAGVLGSAARAVFSVALYRYASGTGATGPFTEDDLEGAVGRKGSGLLGGEGAGIGRAQLRQLRHQARRHPLGRGRAHVRAE